MVLDEQQREVELVGSAREQLGQLVDLAVAEAGGGLVEHSSRGVSHSARASSTRLSWP